MGQNASLYPENAGVLMEAGSVIDFSSMHLHSIRTTPSPMIRTRREALVLLGGVASPWLSRSQPDRPRAARLLLIVVDGLRPDFVTPNLMPRLSALADRGVRFERHHAVFPTVTRVNASSIVTGAYPETHGLLGNAVYSERTFPTKNVDTSNAAELDAMERAEGVLLTAPSLGASLREVGKRMAVFSAGSSGSARLLGSPRGAVTVVNPGYAYPEDQRPRIVAALGPPPDEAVPNTRRNRWIVDTYLSFGLDAPGDVTVLWLADPDETAHATGLGSPETIVALRQVDGEIGRIEETLSARGLFEGTNLMVTSDHGFSTHTGRLRLSALVAPFARALSDGTPDIVVAEGAVHFRGARDPGRVAALVAALQRRPEVGAIFTRPASRTSAQGSVPGTLSFDVARWGHARAADVLVSANWTADKDGAGWAGHTTQGGVAGHGTSSPYDIHNTLIAIGPDFHERRRSTVPTANADLAPTLLRLAGITIPGTMTGRVIDEALRGGPAPASVRVRGRMVRARTPDRSYEVRAHLSEVAGVRYLDYTEVTRGAPSPG